MNYQLLDPSDQRLRAMSLPVDFNTTPDIDQLITELSVMAKKLATWGLSAPQIGINRRVFVMNDGEKMIAVINPEVVLTTDEMLVELEGCANMPNLFLPVRRPSWVNATWHDSDGLIQQHLLDGMAARVFLQKLDHLNGILFVDRVSRLKIDMAKRKMIKANRKLYK